MKLRFFITTLWLALLSTALYGQYDEGGKPYIFTKRTAGEIRVDGVLDDAVWKDVIPITNFWQNFPADTVLARQQTEIYMSYNDEYLYVATKCYSISNKFVVPSLKRDYRAGGSDNITLVFDPFNDNTNAFIFGLNPFGVQREALVSNGGLDIPRDWDDSWDSKWLGDAKIYEDHWIAEFAIPFRSIRFREGSTKWNFNSYRFDSQSNERSTWVQIPQNQFIVNLGYMGDMRWEEPLKKQGGGRISLIPYVTGSSSQDYEEKGDLKGDWNVGGDAKISITSGLNLDLTLNPDFSQVEVDRQVTNLDRFEIFFPERRQFFLENADLFGGFGNRRINPFFSRRIGVATELATGDNIENAILYGARLSGKINNNWRLGLLNMQTAKDEENALPSYNYSVAAVQRKLFNRSSVGLIFVNKNELGSDSNEVYNPYNRIAGIDYNLASADNRWTGKFFLHRAFTPGQTDGQWAQGARLKYQRRRFALEWRQQRVEENYNAEVGFVPRLDFLRLNPGFQVFFYPSNSRWLNRHSVGGEVELWYDPELGRTDREFELYWDFQLRDQSRLQIEAENKYTLLLSDFDPTVTESTPLLANTDYSYSSVSVTYNSDRRKAFFYRLNPSFGQYFNGTRLRLSGNVGYRFQPYGSITVNTSYNYIELPKPYATATLLLIGPRIDLTFTKNLFFTTFIQYNNQIDNLNINARFQWRFKPVSDFFIVYTDNYSTDFNIKSRAVVFKLTYWLNL